MQKIKEGFGKKMKLKKTSAVAVAALLAIGLTACGGGAVTAAVPVAVTSAVK